MIIIKRGPFFDFFFKLLSDEGLDFCKDIVKSEGEKVRWCVTQGRNCGCPGVSAPWDSDP